ncbi:MAG: carboxypeptidase regulatory-like domain-containing protein, partial [Deltaproteobacteria bacterium]|nr:carboxypeptidase regulatory-like domain-containing protein [Deltaproteobacteria bacterium]
LAMVGQVLDPNGAPVPGVLVESIEAGDRTDAEGAFFVQYKAPEQHVHFLREGVWYRRVYRAEDDGQVLVLRLPPVRAVRLDCERVEPCDLTLSWDLGDGFSARMTTRCPHGDTASLQGVPVGEPEAGCVASSLAEPLPANLRVAGDAWTLRDAPQSVRVELRTEDGSPPASCQVTVGDQVADPSGEGFWVAEAAGTVTIAATCDQRPAAPRAVRVRGDTAVTLDWSPMGPDVDLSPWMLQASEITLAAVGEEEAGWRVHIPQVADGLYRLPPLSAGRYHLLAGSVEEVAEPEVAPRAGVLHLIALRRGDDDLVVGLSGVLLLEADTSGGQIRVEGP